MSDPLPIGRHLASYKDSVEYQIGSTLVWVYLEAEQGPGWSVRRANEMFDALWAAIPDVVRVAQQASRNEKAEFWAAHDRAGTANEQLSVWSLTIYPGTGRVDYDVSENHDFERDGRDVPDWPADEFIRVSRRADGRYSVSTDSAEYSFGAEA